MLPEEYIKQQIAAGYKIHFHDNVWWQRSSPHFYKPAYSLQALIPGESKPKKYKSLLGYSHLVSEECIANKYWSVMLLRPEKLKEFSIENLSKSRRSKVRKGLKFSVVKRIENIYPVIDDIKNVLISTAMRTHSGLPPEYYVKRYKKWRSWITTEFSLSKREWWGVFYEGTLIAYRYSLQINDTMFFFASKSHTDYLDKTPNDALMFTILNYCKGLEDCKQVISGDWSAYKSSLNEFKQQYGFERVDLPVYAHYNPLIKLGGKVIRVHR